MKRNSGHAAYGTACANCSRLKCRCVIPNAGGACERCRRLGKDCLPLTMQRTRTSKKGATSRNQLEAKIDGLVSLLTSSRSQPVDVAEGDILSTRDEQYTKSDCRQPGDTVMVASSLECGADHPDEIFRDFCDLKLPQFPFIHIPDQTSVTDLSSGRPFLWLCIVAVSEKSTSKQSELYSQIRNILGKSMVADLERNLDQLHGLLVCLAWGNLQVNRRPFLTLFTQLAISVVFDLGLNKAPPDRPDERSKYRFHRCWVPHKRTIEERRAVLACFFMSSVLSSYLKRIDTLSWTSHMTECLGELEESETYAGDKTLVALVRVQLIVEKVRSSPWQEAGLQAAAMERVAPPTSYARILRTELKSTRQLIPPNLSGNGLLLCYIHSTELAIYDFSLPSNETLAHRQNFDLLESRYICLSALESYFEVFLTLSPSHYTGFTTPMLLQVTHCLYCLYKLMSINDPAWDNAAIIKKVDLIGICQQIAQTFKDAAVIAGIICDGPEDVLIKLSTVIDSAKCHWEPKLAAQVIGHETSWNGQDLSPMQLEDLTAASSEEIWLTDLLAPIDWLQ